MIPLKDITISQETLRNPLQLPPMVEHVAHGGKFCLNVIKEFDRENQQLIYLCQFPDGLILALDGHHRIISIELGGREQLKSEEYTITNWTYDIFEEISFYPNEPFLQWVTPMAPKTEVRIGELQPYKTQVRTILLTQGKQAAQKFIRANRGHYCRPRKIHRPKELAAIYLDKTR